MARTRFKFNFHLLQSSSLCARLHIRRSRQNTFYTITDLTNNVVQPLSLGLMTANRNKRVKLSTATLERLFLQIKATLRAHSVDCLTLMIRSRLPRWNLNFMKRMFALQGIRILSAENRRLDIHGFIRAPKEPRR